MAAEAQPPESDTLSVLQWNVWYRAKPERVAGHLAQLLEEYGTPDIFCLQEVTQPAKDALISTINPQTVSYAVTRKHANGTVEGQAIMSTRLLGDGLTSGVDTILLSRGGRAPFKASGSSVRVLQKAIVPMSHNRTLVVANAHTSYPIPTNGRQRRHEREGLFEALTGEENVILTGDFNASAHSAVVRQLGKSLIRPPFRPTWTSTYFDKVGLLRRRLDHVFVSPSLEITRLAVLNSGPSDHAPVLVTVKFPDRELYLQW